MASPEGKAKAAEHLFLTGVIIEALRVQTSAEGGPAEGLPEEEPAVASSLTPAAPARTRRRLLTGVVGIAVSVVLGIAILLWFSNGDRNPVAPASLPVASFAEVERIKGETFVVNNQQARPALVGQASAPGDGIATEGPESEAVVSIKGSVRLTLAGDTTLHTNQPEDDDLKLVLEKGGLLVEVTRSLKRKKMTVQTPLGVAVAETEEACVARSDAAGVVVLRGEVTFRHKVSGKTIRLAEGEYMAISATGVPYVSRLLSGNAKTWTTFPRCRHEHQSPAYSMAFSPDGKQLAAVQRSGLGGLRVGNVDAREPSRELRGDRCVQYSPDGKRLATADQTSVRLYDLSKDGPERVLSTKERKPRVQCVVFSPDGASLAVGRAASKDAAEVEIWDLATGTMWMSWREHQSHVTCLAYSLDGKLLASGGADKTVILWDVDAGREKTRLEPTQIRLSGRWRLLPTAVRWPSRPGLVIFDCDSQAKL